MEATEFRIGNLVKYENRVFPIHTIANEFPTLDTIEFGVGVVDWNNIEPIPLTEEWLLKLGFNDNYYDGYLGIYVNNSDFVITEPKVMGLWQKNYAWQYKCTWDKYTELKYVHQLQNLYFALTGRELTVNK